MNKEKVLVADDHYLVRLGLKVLIESFDNYTVSIDVENGKDAIEAVDLADIFILDLEMPVFDGIKALKIIKEKHPKKKVVLLTNSMSIPILVTAKNLKPNGFLFKDCVHQEIKTCLEEISKGNYYQGKNCMAFFNKHAEEIEFVENLLRNLSYLTKTELKILYKISLNLTNPEIAELLYNSPKTIENHRTNISKKLDISGYNNLQVIAVKYRKSIESLYNDICK
ncbi:response regulator transcription factor [Zhouia spongiae]|uniref:Response regulator transcription factor n=1 Tax=Zhouia spongiae TaxID=2202721 RepID=A0ABY3YLP7_9FLAO|nr:response regulator transcription factor [Zhouia spongiae]UNY98757.1 response regulator transcription factor [Zhouia spongiae]